MITSTEVIMAYPWEINKSWISNSKINSRIKPIRRMQIYIRTVVIDTQSLEHGFESWSGKTKDYSIELVFATYPRSTQH